MCTDAFTRSSYSDVLIRRLCIDETGASHVRGRYAGLAPSSPVRGIAKPCCAHVSSQ